MSNSLPPDPEGINDERARRAASALAKYYDKEAAASDLLADLMHWCDRNGSDFDAELARAQWHYDEETQDICD